MVTEAMRILVAVDGSKASGIGVDLVAAVAWPASSEIRVVQAVETGAGLFGGPWPMVAVVRTDELEAEIRAEAERDVDAARERLTRTGVRVGGTVLHGRPASAIVDEARRMRADLIVVGSRGHGTIESMLLGSVSAEVVDHAPVPVLVARGREIGRVVLAWDGSSGATRAADLVRAWPVFAGADIRVVSVADVEVPWWSGFPEAGSPAVMPMYVDAANANREHHDELARLMTDQLRAAGIRAEAERRDGDAATEILAAATAWNADLIVMGTHGRTGLKRIVLGSVARNVIRHATCSVLVVRDGFEGPIA
jgi:nucleotide-binding universal stress UspA family protein